MGMLLSKSNALHESNSPMLDAKVQRGSLTLLCSSLNRQAIAPLAKEMLSAHIACLMHL